ncbi:inositol-pentakisphosphate 2-kinase isoform X1 [Hylaeus anthracinus]|uniref:inositol-pentakisphosphate 2-kinase isoform X1 n=3 Tax=Hylaeus anthracinus TaxID=313031 RepID=UPI0023B987F5|nr:inositol-pentakisphosphate 2-kinase isoform X1 [Hylaeus anthracinus]
MKVSRNVKQPEQGAGQSERATINIDECYSFEHMDKDNRMRISEGNPVETATLSSESMTTSTGSTGDDYPAIPEPPLPSTPFAVEDCVYRGEGNANVVIALSREHKVIRFRKSLPDDVPPDGGKQRAERELEFVRCVASCFLGPYAQIPEILRYDEKDIARLTETIRPLRPDKRRHMDVTECYATKFPDYTLLRTKCDPNVFRSKTTFCVEIKPKQGYSRDTDCKFQKCPYCLAQYYKLEKGIVTARSAYCPFDLFSGVEERMKSALKGLLASPQNNLKIFKNGIVVYDQDSSSSDLEYVLEEWFHDSVASTSKEYVDKFLDLICRAVLRSFAKEEFKPSSDHDVCSSAQKDLESISYINPDIVAKAKKLLYFADKACDTKGANLPKNCVLERILHMQKLPFISSEHVFNIYSKFRPLLTDDVIFSNLIKTQKCSKHRISSYKSTNNVMENSKMTREFCSKTHIKDDGPKENVSHTPKLTLLPMYLEDTNLSRDQSNVMHIGANIYRNEKGTNCLLTIEDVVCLQNYLLFSCARDCSILIAFRQLNTDTESSVLDEGVINLSDGLSFLCNIGVSDLEPKSLRCIEKHRQRDTNILSAVISILEKELMAKNQ